MHCPVFFNLKDATLLRGLRVGTNHRGKKKTEVGQAP